MSSSTPSFPSRITLATLTSFGAFALLASACAAPAADVASVGPKTVADVPQQEVVGPYVHAGAALPVALDEEIDSQSATAGAAFTAHTEAPLRADDGRMLVPEGAIVRGHVVSTGSVLAPRLRLALESVETTLGSARLVAGIQHAQHDVHAGPPESVPADASPVFVDDYAYPMDFIDYGSGEYPTNGPQGAQALYFPREIHIPRGARMTLVLTRPLFPPGTRVLAAR